MTLPMRMSMSRTSSATAASLDDAASRRSAAIVLRLIRITIDPNASPRPLACDLRRTTRQHFDQPVKIFLALIERFDGNPLVLAMGADLVDVIGHAGMSVGRDAGIAQIAAVGGAGTHDRDHDRSRPELLCQLLDRPQDLLFQLGGLADHGPRSFSHAAIAWAARCRRN